MHCVINVGGQCDVIRFDSVSDFGFSRVVSDAKLMCGTAEDSTRTPVRHDAPESLQEGRPFSTKSDVFMFGCTLWEMWTRLPPFDWIKDPQKLLEMRRKEKLDFGKEAASRWNITSNVGSEQKESQHILLKVKELMLECLRYEADDRPSMSRVVDLLKQLMGLKQDPPKSVISADFADLGAFLASVDCTNHLGTLEKQEVLLKDLPDYDSSDFEKLGIPFGAARRMLKALQKYQ